MVVNLNKLIFKNVHVKDCLKYVYLSLYLKAISCGQILPFLVIIIFTFRILYSLDICIKVSENIVLPRILIPGREAVETAALSAALCFCVILHLDHHFHPRICNHHFVCNLHGKNFCLHVVGSHRGKNSCRLHVVGSRHDHCILK